MNSLFFVVCIVAIACGTSIVHKYLATRADRSEKNALSEETDAQIVALEDRIRVLERIVTENKYDLGKEINKL